MGYFAQLTTHILDPNPFIGIPSFGYQWNKQYEDLNHGFPDSLELLVNKFCSDYCPFKSVFPCPVTTPKLSMYTQM